MCSVGLPCPHGICDHAADGERGLKDPIVFYGEALAFLVAIDQRTKVQVG